VKINLLIEVELSHVQGKFASREQLVEKLVEELEGADPGSVDTDDDAEYAVDDFTVSETDLT
jgi:hypothetical protein